MVTPGQGAGTGCRRRREGVHRGVLGKRGPEARHVPLTEVQGLSLVCEGPTGKHAARDAGCWSKQREVKTQCHLAEGPQGTRTDNGHSRLKPKRTSTSGLMDRR